MCLMPKPLHKDSSSSSGPFVLLLSKGESTLLPWNALSLNILQSHSPWDLRVESLICKLLDLFSFWGEGTGCMVVTALQYKNHMDLLSHRLPSWCIISTAGCVEWPTAVWAMELGGLVRRFRYIYIYIPGVSNIPFFLVRAQKKSYVPFL